MFRESFLHADVLCIRNYCDYILAGIGSSLFIYEGGVLRGRERIFEGERVHQIYVTDKIFVKGGKELAEILLRDNGSEVVCDVKWKIKCKDWIQDGLILNDNLIITTAHNVVELWDLGGECRKKCSCKEKCILYSCKIIGNSLEDLIVLSGTVFSEVVIWSPDLDSNDEQKVIHRLKGHNGVIFSIEVDTDQKLISTTSDDRTLRIWSISTNNSLLKKHDWENVHISLVFTFFGHTARVWKTLILKDHFISVGEDSKMCIWDKNGKLSNSILLHQSSGIRGLHKNSNSILTGGEDGGLIAVPYEILLSYDLPSRLETPKGHTSHRIGFLKKEIITSTDQGCIFILENQNFKVLHEDEEFINYCLMEISKCKRYVALGSLSGRVVILDTKDSSVIFNEILISGKIFSLHFLNDYIVTCELKGEIKVWEINFPKVKLFKNFFLPNSKERWTTCAINIGDNFLIGDRMGNLYNYRTDPNPVQSFAKLHGYLGVTNVISYGDVIFTSGRDGTVKEFTLKDDLQFSLSHKLPMEWIWKIAHYKTDTLILGFTSVFLIVWSMSNREVLIKFDCGGGHRSCDYEITDDTLRFIYIKEKNIYSIYFDLNRFLRLRNGYHTKEINCLKIIPSHSVVISGSEDTTIRIIKIENDIKNLYVLENHISSVRAISILNFTETEKYIITAGGRAQITVWKFDLNNLTCKEIESMRLKKDESKNTEPSLDPETRFMCVDCIKVSNTKFLIATGCSDCRIRIFSYENSLNLIETVSYTHCLLHITFLSVGDNILIISFATDGKIVFWRKLEIMEKLKAIQMHQSGINSFAIRDLGSDLYLLATGGDDNLLTISIVKIDSEIGNISVVNCWKNTKAHSCQITGILLMDKYLLTTSIDQRITVWRYTLQDNNVSAEFLKQYLTPVPDIQGLEFYKNAQGNVSVCVYGKGIEIINVDLQ